MRRGQIVGGVQQRARGSRDCSYAARGVYRYQLRGFNCRRTRWIRIQFGPECPIKRSNRGISIHYHIIIQYEWTLFEHNSLFLAPCRLCSIPHVGFGLESDLEHRVLMFPRCGSWEARTDPRSQRGNRPRRKGQKGLQVVVPYRHRLVMFAWDCKWSSCQAR